MNVRRQKTPKLTPRKLLEVPVEVGEELQLSNKVKPYTIEAMISLKERLNEAKSRMDKLPQDDYVAHSKVLLCLRMTTALRSWIAREMNGQYVTRAWIKYYELYRYYGLIPDGGVRAFCNAELPGASICALNHYMKTIRRGDSFDWRASSLVPEEFEAIGAKALGDNYGLWEYNRDKWLMTTEEGAKYVNNGDATSIDNLHDWERRLADFGVNLYSHDAGIDVSDDYSMQEEKNARLHLGCALAGLLTLVPGGNFIAKQYTFFETLSINLILIYSKCFAEFFICKPMSSGQSNSEIYLVGRGFTGLPAKYREVLEERLANFNLSPLIERENLPSNAIKEIHRFARLLANQQADYINESFDFYTKWGRRKDYREQCRTVDHAKYEFSDIWRREYPIQRIDSSLWLPGRP